MVSFEFFEIRAAEMFYFVNVSQADGSPGEHISLIFKNFLLLKNFYQISFWELLFYKHWKKY